MRIIGASHQPKPSAIVVGFLLPSVVASMLLANGLGGVVGSLRDLLLLPILGSRRWFTGADQLVLTAMLCSTSCTPTNTLTY